MKDHACVSTAYFQPTEQLKGSDNDFSAVT